MAIDIFNMDYDLGVALGISEFIGGMILTLIILFAVISLPIYKKQVTAIMFLGSMVMFISVALSWLPMVCLIVIIALVGLGIADKFTNVISGRF